MSVRSAHNGQVQKFRGEAKGRSVANLDFIPTADSKPGASVGATRSHRISFLRVRGSGAGKPLSPNALMDNHIMPAAKRAGIHLTGWHDFRQTFSSLLRANGEDIKVQQELMRHADIRTTMNIYTRALTSQKREAHSRIVQSCR